ncbi:MAG: hypothetical protein HGB05_01375 [Chloroflexi bacterium]|nr:hypothetical protein [Chloroflexota bacterium]
MTPFILETSRLLIRAFQTSDLHAIHRILDLTFGDGSKITEEEALNERRSWLEWPRLSAEWLPKMFQPPYGDRAVYDDRYGVFVEVYRQMKGVYRRLNQ